MTEIHITADKDTWTGATTTAAMCAAAADDAVVLSAGNDDILHRLHMSGVSTVACPMGGFLAALNLSRALRHIPGEEFEVYAHSPALFTTVESAIKLVGRREPFYLHHERPMPYFPKVEVAKPAEGSQPLLMWLGNITEGCGLRTLIEDLGLNVEKPWRLRVVGQGRARTVSPLLKRTKALDISDRIEWVGYSENPYKHMDGVTAAIVSDADSVVAREFAAASIPVYTKLSDIL